MIRTKVVFVLKKWVMSLMMMMMMGLSLSALNCRSPGGLNKGIEHDLNKS